MVQAVLLLRPTTQMETMAVSATTRSFNLALCFCTPSAAAVASAAQLQRALVVRPEVRQCTQGSTAQVLACQGRRQARTPRYSLLEAAALEVAYRPPTPLKRARLAEQAGRSCTGRLSTQMAERLAAGQVKMLRLRSLQAWLASLASLAALAEEVVAAIHLPEALAATARIMVVPVAAAAHL